MFIIRLLPFITTIIHETAGIKKAEFIIDLISKKERFYYVDSIFDFEKKGNVLRLTLMLPGKGCAWAEKTGGCTMCGFPRKIKKIGKKFSEKDLIALYKTAEIMTADYNPFILTIYNAGSFINDYEIPPNVQIEICKRVKKHHSIQKLFIESRAEFVTEEKIKRLKNELGEKELIVALGLESQDDTIRNKYICKGLSKETYEKAIRIIKNNGGRVLTYVFIKPIYLKEKGAIEEAIKTAEYAFGAGSDEVAFESAFIQEGTLMEKLYKENKFKPPWLWSIIEVIKRTYHLGPIHIGGFNDEPPPLAIPSNCSKCSKKIRNVIQKYRETHNIKIFDNLYCDCKKDWQKLLNSE